MSKKKLGRPVGKRSGYTLSGSARAQRVSAVMSRRRVMKSDRYKSGNVGKGFADDGCCGVLDDLVDGDESLRDFYKGVLLDVTRSPSAFLLKKLAMAEVLLEKERRKGKEEGVSKNFKDVLRLSLQVADVVRRQEKHLLDKGGRARRVMSDGGVGLVLDVDFDSLVEDGKGGE